MKLSLTLSSLLVCAAAGLGASTASAETAPARPAVLLVSIDGLRPDYVLDADRHGYEVPNLRALVRDGVHATGVRGVLPTATYPSHTSLITGVAPVGAWDGHRRYYAGRGNAFWQLLHDSGLVPQRLTPDDDALLPELFPPRVRYSGAGTAYQLGGILGAALAPYIAQKLVQQGGLAWVGGYVSAAALISLLALSTMHETRDRTF